MNFYRNHKNHGFTLIELIVVIAIIGILTATAIPSMIQWREDTRIRNISRVLATDIQFGKARAVRENTDVVIEVPGNNYIVCIDDDSGGDCDAGEQVLRTETLPPGFLLSTDFSLSNPKIITIDSRGKAEFGLDNPPTDQEATITVQSPSGQTADVHVNIIGRVRVED